MSPQLDWQKKFRRMTFFKGSKAIKYNLEGKGNVVTFQNHCHPDGCNCDGIIPLHGPSKYPWRTCRKCKRKVILFNLYGNNGSFKVEEFST